MQQAGKWLKQKVSSLTGSSFFGDLFSRNLLLFKQSVFSVFVGLSLDRIVESQKTALSCSNCKNLS